MIEVRNLTKTSDSRPTQWVGEAGEEGGVYIRNRWGALEVYHSPEARDAAGGNLIFDRQVGGRYDGEMETETMKEHTRSVCCFPE
jgi:hypothetical protein